MRAAALVFVLSLFLAGCSTSSPEGATALDLLDAANQVALAWDPAAQLVSVEAVELHEAMSEDELPDDPVFQAANQPDDNVGDGRTGAWAYEYQADGKEAHHMVVVTEDGEMDSWDREGDQDAFSFAQAPLNEWQLDSTDAAQALRAAPAEFARQADNPDAWVGWSLNKPHESEHAVWIAYVFQSGEPRFYAVDATNGTYMGSFGLEDLAMELHSAPEESDVIDGRVTLVEPTASHVFEVEHAGHGDLIVEFRSVQPSSGATLNVTVYKAEEMQFQEDWELSALGNTVMKVVFASPNPVIQGEWRVNAEMTDGTAQRYEIAWCAPGISVTVEPTIFPDRTACPE